MKRTKIYVCILSIVVLLICVYSFLLGNEVFDGDFANDYVPWYFLAKGIFCSVAMYLLFCIWEALQK